MALLNDNGKLSNPRAGSVRIAADTMSGYSGQRRHDMRIGYQPAYVDSNRTSLNRVLIAPPTPAEMRAIAQTRRAQRETRRTMKSNAAIATSGIITFGSEAAQMFEALTAEQQDQAFRDLAEAVAAHLGTSLHALVVHLDEATIHAHLALCAYGHDGHPLSRTSRPGILSELQDLTAEVLQRYCPEIERGTRYGDRLAAGADWADVIHKTVKELHRTLPADLAAKRDALAELADAETLTLDRVADTKAQLEKLETTADQVRDDVTQLEAHKTQLTDSVAVLKTRQAEVETAKAESDRQAKDAARAAEEKQQAVAEVTAQLETLTTTLAELAAAETIARARVKEMQDRVDALTQKEDRSDKEVKRLAIYEGRLKDRIADLEAARAAAQAARETAETARIVEEDKVRDATRTAAAKQQEAEVIAAQVDTSRATLAALAEKEYAARERVTEIADVIAGLTLTADRTGQDVKRLQDEKKALADRLAALAVEKLAAEAARDETDRQATESARVARERRDEVAAVSAQVEALKGRHADLELDVTLAESEVASLDRKRETLRNQVDEAEQARIAAETARRREEEKAAEEIRKAEAEKAEAARAKARAEVVTAGLAALSAEMAAGTLRLREDGRVTARAPELLRPAYPEIGPAVRAAATVAEQTRAARREADAVAWAAEDARKVAEARIAEDKDAAARAIVQEREEAQVEFTTQREAVTRELAAKRAELERQETEVKKQGALLATLLERLRPLLKRVMRWLSHPDLPPSMKDEGIGLAAEAFSMLGALRQDDPDP